MTAAHSPARRAAFLRALAETGNRTIAAERARVSPSWVTLHRKRDPAFARAMGEAVVTARAALAGRGDARPPRGWGSLDGAQLVVRGTVGRRVQVARAGPRELTPRLEARLLGVLAATCNVKAACAEIGMTAAAVYAHIKRRPRFAERWAEALDIGYAVLEAGLVESACSLFEGDATAPEVVAHPVAFSEALQLLRLHGHRVHGLGKPMRRAREPSIQEVHAALLKRITAVERAAALPPGAMDKARREWDARAG